MLLDRFLREVVRPSGFTAYQGESSEQVSSLHSYCSKLTFNSQIGVVYVCSYCQTPTPQPFGRIAERENKSGGTTKLYRNAQGPPGEGGKCEHCAQTQHVS